MIGIVMAGGRGTRMGLAGGGGGGGPAEKLLLRYRGKPVIMHVVDSLRDSGLFSGVVAATSPNSPRTAALLCRNGVDTVDTPGGGYVRDLSHALGAAAPRDTALVVSGDQALLDADMVQRIAGARDPPDAWTAVLVTDRFLGSVGLGPGAGPRPAPPPVLHGGRPCRYTGISVVDTARVPPPPGRVGEGRVIIDDVRTAFNLNTARDYEFLLGTA